MVHKWKTPEEIQFQKKRKEKLLFLATSLLSILLGTALLTNKGW
ncbi:hypothetical protein [Guptibacillus spartinae]|nr:hypothetical protein [Pseudalkalibacillus spartinae]